MKKQDYNEISKIPHIDELKEAYKGFDDVDLQTKYGEKIKSKILEISDFISFDLGGGKHFLKNIKLNEIGTNRQLTILIPEYGNSSILTESFSGRTPDNSRNLPKNLDRFFYNPDLTNLGDLISGEVNGIIVSNLKIKKLQNYQGETGLIVDITNEFPDYKGKFEGLPLTFITDRRNERQEKGNRNKPGSNRKQQLYVNATKINYNFWLGGIHKLDLKTLNEFKEKFLRKKD